MGMVAPAQLNQAGFRGRYDGLGSANNDDTNWIAAENTNWSQLADTQFRVRIYVFQDERINSLAGYMGLYYSLNGGTFTYLDDADETYTTDSVLHAVLSDDAGYTDGTDTTRIMTQYKAGADYITTNYGIVERDRGSDSTPNVTLPGSGGDGSENDCEFEWCLTIRSEFASPGDTIELYASFSDATLDTVGGSEGIVYAPLITVAGAGNTGTIMKVQGATAAIKGSTLTIK